LGMGRFTFLLAFILGPTLAFGIIPNVIFAFVNGSGGATNIIWGSVFGAGFWLSDLAFWAPGPGGGFRIIKIAGLLWAFLLIPLVLFFASNWLWWNLGERGRKIALMLLFASFLLVVPVRVLEILALHGIVLPDWALFINAVY
jgi:hypothetical protein